MLQTLLQFGVGFATLVARYSYGACFVSHFIETHLSEMRENGSYNDSLFENIQDVDAAEDSAENEDGASGNGAGKYL